MAVGVSVFGLLALLVLAALLVGLIAGLVMAFRSPAGRGADGGTCGKCGYSVRGLTALNCPECGADLREVGITRDSGTRRRTGFLLAGICGALLGMCVCSGVAMAFFGARSVHVGPPVSQQAIQQPQPQPAPPLSPSPNP